MRLLFLLSDDLWMTKPLCWYTGSSGIAWATFVGVPVLAVVEVVRSLLHAPGVSEGFPRLHQKGRLDLAVEAIILKPEWHGLFTAEERQAARERLASVHYRAPWDDGAAPAGER